MKTPLVCGLVVAAQCSLATFTASAHPGSGIVVDQQGSVYFTHIGRGVGKIDPQGKLTYVGNTRGGHWMCLDPEGSFSRTRPKHFERITPDGVKPALIYADGGSPIAVLRDGNLYYASNEEKGMQPGGLQVTRQSPGGEISIFPPDGKKTTGKLGITGLAPGPDGSLYIASPSAVLKLKMDAHDTRQSHRAERLRRGLSRQQSQQFAPLPPRAGCGRGRDGLRRGRGLPRGRQDCARRKED
jgi:DNA-binding beta-propeller fold protein YncE